MFDLDKAAGFMFDCDGTLLDALDAWEIAERDLFAQAPGLSADDEAEIHTAPIDEAAVIMHEKHGIGESAEAVLAHLDAHLLPFYSEQAEALPGAVEFVRKVHEANIPCIVISSSPQRYLEAGLERIGIRDCFKQLVSTEDTRTSKLDPKTYEIALEALGTPLTRTWAIDDAPYALAAMREAGLNTIGVENGCSPERAAAIREQATLYVDTLEEL